MIGFRVLGAIEAHRDGASIPLSRAHRLLVAALLSARGAVVSRDRLTDLLWGDDQPSDPVNSLHSHVSRLRARLGDASPLVNQDPGYRLDTGALDVDLFRFEALVAAAQEAPPDLAAATLEEALGLWTGPAYAEFASLPLLQPEVRRAEELALSARERWVDARLALGGAAGVIGDLEALVAAHPFRERFWLQLGGALHASGRQADALEAMRRYREVLADEGLEPSARAAALVDRIFAEPVADAPVPSAPPAATAPAAQGPPPLAPGATPAPLPRRPTSFVGRSADLAGVRRLLEVARIVTIVGPGGVGKTRLALEVADADLGGDHLDDGVWLLELDRLVDPGAVRPALATLLGLPFAGADPDSILRSWLRDRRMLLVIDNCEHLLDAVAELVESLVRHCPDVLVLATSREPLGVDGEHLWPLEPLPADGPAARALFADRARAVHPSFTLDEESEQAVDAICRALDGIPLAIEMAAARSRTEPLTVLAARLGTSLDGLRSGRRTAPPRHQTLEAAVAWSHDLLDETERVVFRRLAVFAGAFTEEDAATVAGDVPGSARPTDAVARLVDRSLVTVSGDGYQLLATLRAYATERLAEAGESREVGGRHIRWAVHTARRIAEGLRGPDEAAWSETLDRRFPDLDAARRRALADGDVDAVLRMLLALYTPAYDRMRSDVLSWAGEVLTIEGARSHPLAAVAHAGCALTALLRGDVEVARRGATEAAESAGDPRAVLHAEAVLSDLSVYEGDLDGSAAHARRMQALAAEVGDEFHQFHGRLNEALAAAYAGRLGEALAVAARVRRGAELLGSPTMLSWADYLDGELLADADPQRAIALLDRAVERSERMGSHFVGGVARVSATTLRARHGDPATALREFAATIAHWRELDDRTHQETTLRNLVVLLARVGAWPQAATLYGAVAAGGALPSYGAERDRLEAAMTAARSAIGRAAGSAEAAGAELGFDGAVSWSLDELAVLGRG